MEQELSLVGRPGEGHRNHANKHRTAPQHQPHFPVPAGKPDQLVSSEKRGTRSHGAGKLGLIGDGVKWQNGREPGRNGASLSWCGRTPYKACNKKSRSRAMMMTP